MPSGRFKSKRFRKVSVKTPGGKVVTHYKEKNPKAARCAIFGVPLAAVPRKRPAKMANLPKTKKRPQRPFGGVLSSKGMRAVMIEKARIDFEMKDDLEAGTEADLEVGSEASSEVGGDLE